MAHMLPRDVQAERNKVIVALAVEEGIEQKEIVKRIEGLGYGTITTERVSQVLTELSGRERVHQFLTQNSDVNFDAQSIAKNLDIDIPKVMWVLDSLSRQKIVEFDEETASNGHRTLVNVQLKKGAKAKKQREQRKPFTLESEPAGIYPKATVEDMGTYSVVTEEDPDEQAAIADGFSPVHTVKPLEVVARDEADAEKKPDIPWVAGNLGGWPAIRDVRDRAQKAQKLSEAAKLLEEVGEDEIALDLMAKTEFSPLENEVIEILKHFKEL